MEPLLAVTSTVDDLMLSLCVGWCRTLALVPARLLLVLGGVLLLVAYLVLAGLRAKSRQLPLV